jgi:hypothetical protein
MVTVGRACLALFHRTLQAHLLHQPLDALVIDRPPLPFQQGGQAAIAIGRVLARQRQQRLLQFSAVALLNCVVKRAARQPDDGTDLRH